MNTLVTAGPLVLAKPAESLPMRAHPRHKIVLKFQCKGRWYLFRRGQQYKYEILVANTFTRWFSRWLRPIYGVCCSTLPEDEISLIATVHGGRSLSKSSERYLKNLSPDRLKEEIAMMRYTINSMQCTRTVKLQLAEDFPKPTA